MKSKLYQYRAVILLVILAFAFFTRMYRLHQPSRYIFDEVYHAVTAKLIARNDKRAFEWWNPVPEPDTAVDWLHPPLAKYTQAIAIRSFGENSFGWRFSSALFGVLVIVMVYHLAYKLFRDYRVALLSALIASLDGLLLVQSRIAMNDIHVTFFILLTLYNYLHFRENRKLARLFLTGITAGLAVASKWSGVFVVGIIFFAEGLYFLQNLLLIFSQTKDRFSEVVRLTASFIATRLPLLILLPICVYVASYSMMFLQGKDWAHFKELHNQIWWYQTHLEATHPYQSRPIEWFFNLRPVWVHVEYSPENTRSNIYALGNPAVFWIGCLLVFFTLISFITRPEKYLLVSAKKAKLTKRLASLFQNLASQPLIFLFISYIFVWLPWQLSPRIMFFYHYTPAVPLLAILIGYWLLQIKKKLPVFFYTSLALMVLCFIVWYPHWTGIQMQNSFIDSVYFLLPQWK